MIFSHLMECKPACLKNRFILLFWLPLASTWLMMSVEGPYITSIISRLSEAKFNLAAFGVAFSLAMMFEAPIIMILSAATALVSNRHAYHKLYRFTFILNTCVTLLMIIILLTPLFTLIVEGMMELPKDLTEVTRLSAILLIPWPAAIGYRRFFQGILIQSHQTKKVAYGTLGRLLTMSITAVVLLLFRLKGAYIGAAALSLGVVGEAIMTRIMAIGTVKKTLTTQPNAAYYKNPLTYPFIVKFYYPLALTSILALGIHPMITFFLGKSRFPIESLATLPVINALIFVFRSLGLSYQEVSIALLGDDLEHYSALRRFAWILSAIITILLGFIAFTPMAKLWYQHVAGLSNELIHFVFWPTQIQVILPALTVWSSFQRAVQVKNNHNTPITIAAIVEVVVIAVVLKMMIFNLQQTGVVAAAWAYTLGRLAGNLYLSLYQWKVKKGIPLY